MAQTLTTELQQIDGAEILDINSAQSVQRTYQLPEIVNTGKAGTQIDDLELLHFTNNGEGPCRLIEFETARLFLIVQPYERVILRAVMVGLEDGVGWQVVDNRETIVAATPETHVANAAFTAVTTTDAATAVSSADTYTEGDAETGFNAGVDAAGATFETDFDASAAEFETKFAAMVDVLEAQNVSAAA